jgi:hypothetical protein
MENAKHLYNSLQAVNRVQKKYKSSQLRLSALAGNSTFNEAIGIRLWGQDSSIFAQVFHVLVP